MALAPVVRNQAVNDRRLIERWLPIAELGVESLRERTPMTPFPAPNRLHVWWARRPLVASRAAVLASLLPEDADRDQFLHAIGIHGDPVAARRLIDRALRSGQRIDNPYDYDRAFGHNPDSDDREWLTAQLGDDPDRFRVLDPTSGGGSVPLEAVRLGFATLANDLNPVAVSIIRATVEQPLRFGGRIESEFRALATVWRREIENRLDAYYPQADLPDRVDTSYLWARTITCPYCKGLVPLSPNWRLAPGGLGVRLVPYQGSGASADGRICSFEIVRTAGDQSEGTVARGDGICPFGDCGRVVDGDEIKRQAREGRMGEQLFAVVYKRRVKTTLKSGKRGRDRWVREYRAPRPEDDNRAKIRAWLEEKLPEWEVFDMVPSERFPTDANDDRPIQYGMPLWRDLFSPRQLLCHGTSVEVFREMFEADRSANELSDLRKAAYGYLALAIDKVISYNNLQCRWAANRAVISQVFERHDFSFKWSFAEMAPLVSGAGYDWALTNTSKCMKELLDLTGTETSVSGSLPLRADSDSTDRTPPPVTVTCKSGDRLDHIPDSSIDAVVMDPPYYDNVMYAELSDFFYVWLKRTAGRVFPELFRRPLTDKDSEAVANPMRFRGRTGARALAGLDYQDRMAAIFAECRRMLKPDGILTLMFTHKATGAWDALTTGLMESDFAITASWPINTESPGSLHIKDKAAANSTVFLVCRPRAECSATDATVYWEHVEPKVASAVRERVAEFQAAGIRGVDLYLACFGPALEEFSRHWPVERGQPRRQPESRGKSRQQLVPQKEWDPYAVTPEDALDTASREVKRWRLEQLTHLKAYADLDAPTAFFVLAWDTFNAPVFSYDEALRLARAVGTDLDKQVVKRMAEKSGSNLRIWDSVRRSAKGSLGPTDGSRGMIDAIHHAARLARIKSLDAARELLAKARVDREPRFFAALEAVLEVLPISTKHTGVQLEGDLAASGSDFEALYDLYRLAYSDKIDEPEQLKIWRDDIG